MRIRIIDAFADRAFAGNPAGVCLLASTGWPDETWMQNVAAELNLSETAFAHPLPEGEEADWNLRWFTPAVETNLCGHATLATAHALHTDGAARRRVSFSTLSGILVAHMHGDGTITLDFPAARLAQVDLPEGLAEALVTPIEAAYGTGSLGDLVTVFADEGAVRELDPDLAAVARICRREDIRGVIATAPAASDAVGYDFVSRFFAPAAGIAEDPVTGSAHTALAPYWSERLDRPALTGLQASARTGLVRTEVNGERVQLTGEAVTVVDGTLLHAPG